MCELSLAGRVIPPCTIQYTGNVSQPVLLEATVRLAQLWMSELSLARPPLESQPKPPILRFRSPQGHSYTLPQPLLLRSASIVQPPIPLRHSHSTRCAYTTTIPSVRVV